MAQDGNTASIGTSSADAAGKDFQGAGIEGQKGTKDNSADKKDPDPRQAKARMMAIIGVIALLDQETEFTAGGKPEVRAIEELLGFDITGAERDRAWEAFQEEMQKGGEPEPHKRMAPNTAQAQMVSGEHVLRRLRAQGKRI